MRATLMRELEAAHPVVIIVEAGDFAPDIVGNTMDSKQSMLAFPQLNDYLSKYFKPIAQVGRLTIYRRSTVDIKINANDIKIDANKDGL